MFKGGTFESNPKMFEGAHLSTISCFKRSPLTQILKFEGAHLIQICYFKGAHSSQILKFEGTHLNVSWVAFNDFTPKQVWNRNICLTRDKRLGVKKSKLWTGVKQSLFC